MASSHFCLNVRKKKIGLVNLFNWIKRNIGCRTVSHVFHGRDIFSPVAAHLANGVSLPDLGTEFADPVRLQLPQPQRISNGWRGEIIHVDHFGNLASNIRVREFRRCHPNKDKYHCQVEWHRDQGHGQYVWRTCGRRSRCIAR